ncbi:Ethanolamine utilization protein EutN [BD1-7 clade bacterium]|uniref:Ethanolamine utilization protein EutN n=1 Tax=BD1-7 clade bacterium TaxID=2029982 RepID=A0A5S9R082_9GAMM|nr:Ethanolamine utilization protein EutN [BD1-7 clade bacterium]CAA0117167.1 Ethanolamine utilization protein EutN [BD1-7 clade bacterium]CAA0125031.1 Ethanolamine utilization protein EutN [BD1-7 clade bacterium]
MRLAKVIGQVVATVRNPHLSMDKLLLVQLINDTGSAESDVHVAVDNLGAGEGEVVLVVAGSSARLTLTADAHTPVDLSIVGIVDEITSTEKLNYLKQGRP